MVKADFTEPTAWGNGRGMVKDHDPNTQAEDRATTGGYPQINLNTGISFSAVALLVGMVIWTVGIKNDVDNHGQRITAVEIDVRSRRTTLENYRFAQADAATKLEGRLATIEGMLRDLLSRRAP